MNSLIIPSCARITHPADGRQYREKRIARR
jgi:hypothetical protein